MVNVNPGLLITFAFGTLSLEHHDNCNFDYLEVKLVTSWIHFKGVFCAYVLKCLSFRIYFVDQRRTAPRRPGSGKILHGILSFQMLIKQFIGVIYILKVSSHIANVVNSERNMMLGSTTGFKWAKPGVLQYWDELLECCGETLTEPTGSFTSPGHPTDYPHGANCTWYISVEPGNLIRLSFTTFNLEYHTNCAYDYVDTFDDLGHRHPLIEDLFCGRSVPPSLTSTDSLMTVLLVSDSSLSAEGFSAEYVSINASTGIILLQ
uniref:CUB domain-containing protein n=1 Tax=Sinocyclocheilus rhinocerous TaxID=307959 RepID=A0A673JJD7_9TELE